MVDTVYTNWSTKLRSKNAACQVPVTKIVGAALLNLGLGRVFNHPKVNKIIIEEKPVLMNFISEALFRINWSFRFILRAIATVSPAGHRAVPSRSCYETLAARAKKIMAVSFQAVICLHSLLVLLCPGNKHTWERQGYRNKTFFSLKWL